jgi:hypothetical protein
MTLLLLNRKNHALSVIVMAIAITNMQAVGVGELCLIHRH